MGNNSETPAHDPLLERAIMHDVARIADGGAWVWLPLALTEALARAVETIGRAKVPGWRAERLLMAHGESAQNDASTILANALAWI